MESDKIVAWLMVGLGALIAISAGAQILDVFADGVEDVRPGESESLAVAVTVVTYLLIGCVGGLIGYKGWTRIKH